MTMHKSINLIAVEKEHLVGKLHGPEILCSQGHLGVYHICISILQCKGRSGIKEYTKSFRDVLFIVSWSKAVTMPQPSHIGRWDQGCIIVFVDEREPAISVSL